ncbi:uncharacterized protein BDR25DRAFT_356440 [Lindgomyces ingoldianus]|uniref:Uncharacterized protein n=1 Tax=Lindgomyces ingoldianus TaxID=673940 RepID=A0ACB6QUD6_9PLEO|nr:uncharacterized protein BDR25DRAFT_356440 [Lindgomyces ingoldianus]KAF2469700.1 hypothetical protein BDR25DRAFT_356440 [Lindgomyces ingoldianus]
MPPSNGHPTSTLGYSSARHDERITTSYDPLYYACSSSGHYCGSCSGLYYSFTTPYASVNILPMLSPKCTPGKEILRSFVKTFGGLSAVFSLLCSYSASDPSVIQRRHFVSNTRYIIFPNSSLSSNSVPTTPDPGSSIAKPASTTTSASPSPSSHENTNTGVIAGSFIGGVAVLGPIGGAFQLLTRTHPNQPGKGAGTFHERERYDPHLLAHYPQSIRMETPPALSPVPLYPGELGMNSRGRNRLLEDLPLRYSRATGRIVDGQIVNEEGMGESPMKEAPVLFLNVLTNAAS